MAAAIRTVSLPCRCGHDCASGKVSGKAKIEVRDRLRELSTCNLEDVSQPAEDEEPPATPDPGVEWWTTKDVAAYLRVRMGTVSTYRTRGQMPPPDQTVGRTHMWHPATVIAWHEKRPRPGVGGRLVDNAPKRKSGTL